MRNWVIGAGTPVLLLVAWWFLSANSTDPFFPPLETILVRFQELVAL